jgi:hypothetical protein
VATNCVGGMVINLDGDGERSAAREHFDISPPIGKGGSIMNISLKVLFINLCEMKFCGSASHVFMYARN